MCIAICMTIAFPSLTQRSNLVVAYAKTVALRNVEFRVRKGGQQKVRESGRKNVHAFVVGEISSKQSIEGNGTVVSYNPYRNDTFVEKETQSPIHSCLYAIMEGTGLLAYN